MSANSVDTTAVPATASDASSPSAIKTAMQIANFVAISASDATVDSQVTSEVTPVDQVPAAPAFAGPANSPVANEAVVSQIGLIPTLSMAPIQTVYTPPVSAENMGHATSATNVAPVATTPAVSDSASDTEVPYVPLEDREFICMNDEYSECRTGQYTMSLARKVISDHFGRNKACTRDIADWPLFCRKHYQRATYNHGTWQIRKISLIMRQFDVIEAQFPGTTYNVVFKKSEESRLNEFCRKLAAGMNVQEASANVKPSPGKVFQAPIDVLRELQFALGSDKTINEVKDTMGTIGDMLEKKETITVPSIEFLPVLPNSRRKTARITSKGAIAKPIPKTPSPKRSKKAVSKKPSSTTKA